MPSKGKVRLAELLVSRRLCTDSAEAERLIHAGLVLGNEEKLTHPGMQVNSNLTIRIKSRNCYVSRGGDKLAGALSDFSVDVLGRRCLDVGASTGGFTDCLLQHGASEVTALDVAYGQFAWSLRTDARVRLFERTNIRDADPVAIGAPFDVIVTDLSFASLRSVISSLVPLCADKTQLIVLVKPQFEAPDSLVSGGVVSDSSVHIMVLNQVIEALTTHGLTPQAASFSCIRGAKGNIEFFLLAQYGGIPVTIDTIDVVTRAHEGLGCGRSAQRICRPDVATWAHEGLEKGK